MDSSDTVLGNGGSAFTAVGIAGSSLTSKDLCIKISLLEETTELALVNGGCCTIALIWRVLDLDVQTVIVCRVS